MRDLRSGAAYERDRVFVPGYRRCWAGRVVEKRWIRALLECYPHSRLASRIRHALGTYHTILLQRPAGREE